MPIAKTIKFNFKSRAIKDEAGKEIGRTKKQPSVVGDIPVPTSAEVVALLTTAPDSKESTVLMDAISGIFVRQAKDQFDEIIEGFGEDDSKEVSLSMLDYDKLTLEYIASIPPSQRGVQAISEEDWEAFYVDYMAVMVAATGKTEDRIKNHVNLFKKPQKAKANKEVLQVLIDQLDIYMASSANIEDTAACADRISTRFKTWLVTPDKAVAADML